MNRPGLKTIPFLILLLIFGLTLLTPPAVEAQHRLRDPSLAATEGEPTDPEEALALLESGNYDGDFDVDEPEDDDEAATWFEALLNLLYELGLLGGASGESGS